MENDMTTMTADPAVAHQLTSYKDVIRICSLSPLENEVRSNYMDFK